MFIGVCHYRRRKGTYAHAKARTRSADAHTMPGHTQQRLCAVRFAPSLHASPRASHVGARSTQGMCALQRAKACTHFCLALCSIVAGSPECSNRVAAKGHCMLYSLINCSTSGTCRAVYPHCKVPSGRRGVAACSVPGALRTAFRWRCLCQRSGLLQVCP